MTRGRLLGGTSIGRQAFAPIPPQVTRNVEAFPAPTADEILATMKDLIHRGDLADLRPSVIVVGDDVPNALTVTDARALCFLTLSRDGLAAIVAHARPIYRTDTTTPSIFGFPVVDVDRLAESDYRHGRDLAAYYQAAIRGYLAGIS